MPKNVIKLPEELDALIESTVVRMGDGTLLLHATFVLKSGDYQEHPSHLSIQTPMGPRHFEPQAEGVSASEGEGSIRNLYVDGLVALLDSVSASDTEPVKKKKTFRHTPKGT